MADSKPQDVSGYSQEVTQACEQALVTVLGCMGNLKDTVRLVGGLVPRYLRIPVLMDTQFGDVVRQFGATTAPTTSSNCG